MRRKYRYPDRAAAEAAQEIEATRALLLTWAYADKGSTPDVCHRQDGYWFKAFRLESASGGYVVWGYSSDMPKVEYAEAWSTRMVGESTWLVSDAAPARNMAEKIRAHYRQLIRNAS